MLELIIEDVWYSYPTSTVPVLKGINLRVSKGEFLAIMGPTGAGKTTLCLTLNGLIPHFFGGEMKGRVIIAGKDTRKCSVPELAQKVGIVFQDPESQLFCMTVEDEVAFGPENLGVPPEEVERRVDWALGVVRMKEFRQRHPVALSGGQKQRVAIAAALSMLPEVLVLDEPTASLDPIGKTEVFSVVKDLKEKLGITTIMVEHEYEEIARFSDRIIVMSKGEIVAEGTPKDIFLKVETLKKVRLGVPQVSELAYMLNINMNTKFSFIDLDEAEKELSKPFFLKKSFGNYAHSRK